MGCASRGGPPEPGPSEAAQRWPTTTTRRTSPPPLSRETQLTKIPGKTQGKKK